METIDFTVTLQRSADWKSQGSSLVKEAGGGGVWRHLHAAVCHGHGIIRHGIAGDLAVVGTGGGCKNVARVDKVRTGGVSPAVGPGGKHKR